MNIKEIFTKTIKVFDRKPKPLPSGSRGIGTAIAKIDNATPFGTYFTPIIARAGITKTYEDFTEEVIKQLPDDQVRNLIKRSSPIVAKALADYSDNISSAGYTWTSDRTQGQTPETPAQQLISDFITLLEIDQGGIEGLIGEMSRGMFSHGGVFTELVIDEDGRTPVRLKVLDPTTARYRKNKDEIYGDYYELGQDLSWGIARPVSSMDRIVRMPTQIGSENFISFHNDPTIQYRPIQKEANNPYGTPILDPAVFHVIMMAGFFASFQDALTGHVWPNLLITIDFEKFRANAGPEVQPKEIEEKLNKAIQDIKDNTSKLKPGQALITGDDVSIGGTITGQSKSPMGSIKDIQDVIRRELIIAVQSQPILMGSNETIAETHAIEQIKAYGKLIRRSQRILNGLFTDYFNLILSLNGYPPLADFRLSYVSTADYKDQAATYKAFREGLKVGSEDMQQLVLALDAAVASEYMTRDQAKEAFDHELEIRRQVNILPQDL